jgi:hypothetical protein
MKSPAHGNGTKIPCLPVQIPCSDAVGNFEISHWDKRVIFTQICKTPMGFENSLLNSLPAGNLLLDEKVRGSKADRLTNKKGRRSVEG